MMILYGIPNCDKCRHALKALREAGFEVSLWDIRKEPLGETEIAKIVCMFGAKIINKASLTYRGFGDEMKKSTAEAQIKSYPTVMKRPVIQDGNRMTLGWAPETQKYWIDKNTS